MYRVFTAYQFFLRKILLFIDLFRRKYLYIKFSLVYFIVFLIFLRIISKCFFFILQILTIIKDMESV